jgi:hypothetical protein
VAQWSNQDNQTGAAVEDENLLEDEPEIKEPLAWQRYELYTRDDGLIAGMTSTNDNLDTGYPGEYADWKVEYKDKASMLKALSGGSHIGISGVHVEVYLDGEEVGEPLGMRRPVDLEEETLGEEMDRDVREFGDEGGAWSRYDLQTMPGGSIAGRCQTNDDGDTGYAGQYAEWEVKYKDKVSMLKALSGGSHVGISGVRVEVTLDGEEIGDRLSATHEDL